MRNRFILFILKYWFRLFPKGFIYFGHGVGSEIKDPLIERIHLPTSDLIYILDFWQALDFEFISMEKLLLIKDKKFNYQKPWIHLTFDDGYRNNLTDALPILASRNIPFSVFVSTGMVSQNKRFDTFKIRTAIWFTKNEIRLPIINAHLNAQADARKRREFIYKINKAFKQLNRQESLKFMSAIENLLSHEQWKEINERNTNDAPLSTEELIELASHPLVFIGAHGEDHIIHNDKLEDEFRKKEIIDSKKWLEELLNRRVDAFAFPNGGLNDYNEKASTSANQPDTKWYSQQTPGPFILDPIPLNCPAIIFPPIHRTSFDFCCCHERRIDALFD